MVYLGKIFEIPDRELINNIRNFQDLTAVLKNL